jgi:hypothetical protein
MTPNLATTQPYHWAKQCAELGLDEPGYTNVREPYGYDFDMDLGLSPMFLEGFWSRLYGQDPALKAQEN